MNNRRRLKIKTWLKIKQIRFFKMTDEEQEETLNKFWEKINKIKEESK